MVYKSTPQDPIDRVLVAEYKEITIFPNIVNGKKVDGSDFRIVAGAFVEFLEYPDLTNGAFRTADQIESIKISGRRMVAISERFAPARGMLAPRIEQLKSAAEKLNAGMILVNGQFLKPDQTKGAPVHASGNATITTTTGETIQVRGILRADSTKLEVEHAGGFRTILWAEISAESRKVFENLPEVARQIELAKDKQSAEEESRQDQQRVFNNLIAGTDLIASLFFNSELKRVTAIPQDQQGVWEIIAILDKAAITNEDRNLSLTETIDAVKSEKFIIRTPASIETSFDLAETSFSIQGNENGILYIVTDSSGKNFCFLNRSNLVIKLGDAFILTETALAETAGIGTSLPHNQDKTTATYASFVSIILNLHHVKTIFATRKL